MLWINKSKASINSIIKYQFNYCPLVPMFCSKRLNSLRNKTYEGAYRLACKGNTKILKPYLVGVIFARGSYLWIGIY